MTTTTAPKLAPATIEQTDAGLTVRVRWEPQPGLDRLDCRGWSLNNTRAHRALAARLVRAINAGAAVQPTEPYTDVNGKRGWHSQSPILGRTMNADLRRLGY